MKEHLCKCNMCDTILFDENAPIYEIQLEIPKNTKHMIQVNISDNINEPEYIWACPNCKTDEYLNDIPNL